MSGQEVEGAARGRRVGLTRAKVLAAALEIIDRDGLAALSMRRLGAALGVEAMTIYHYVPNKDALLDGVLEEVFRQSYSPGRGGPWQEQLRSYARRLVDQLQAHPGVVPLMVQRPALTSQTLGLMEQGLALIHAAGFALPRALQMIHALVGLVIGHVIAGSSAAGGADRLGHLAQEDLSAFPLVGRAVQEAADDNLREPFDTALAAMIRGFEADLT